MVCGHLVKDIICMLPSIPAPRNSRPKQIYMKAKFCRILQETPPKDFAPKDCSKILQETPPKDFAVVTALVTYLCKWQSENGRDLIRSGWGGDRRKEWGMKSEAHLKRSFDGSKASGETEERFGAKSSAAAKFEQQD